jgi:diaminohydroxyphosphoribosylaminopyrimidine deaminase/5-amino-6-(5-phosphoribosylamino)uracil reductase
VSRDGVVVGTGYHERAGEPHAEIHALNAAGERARGATLYCTLEPCAHVGRTGPCVARIVEAGIRRVVAAVQDPHPLVAGRGFEYLRGHGITVEVGLGAPLAAIVNDAFLSSVAEQRPFVVLKAATSLDGCIAKSREHRMRLTAQAANRDAQRFRAEIDAIAVGSGTILADDPLLTAREVYRERPLVRVIFDRRLRTPASARVLSTRTAGPVIIMTSAAAAASARAAALRGAGCELISTSGTIRAALDVLHDRNIRSILLEGGAAVHDAAWDEGVVDAVRLYVTPLWLGPGGVKFLEGRPFSTAGLAMARVEALGPDVLIEGYVHRPH